MPSVTLFNALGEDETGQMIWQRKTLDGVYERHRGESLSVSGAKNADSFRLFLFTRAGYLSPEAFEEDPTGHWTLRCGDFLVPGQVSVLPDRPFRIAAVEEWLSFGKFHHWEVTSRGWIYKS